MRMSKLLSLVVAVCGAVPALVHGHAAAPRSPEVEINNAVVVAPASIVVKQAQTFKGGFGQTIWNMIDVNKDGKATPKEKKDFEPQARAFFSDHSSLRINWATLTPNDVAVNLDMVPAKKPKDFEKSPIGFNLTANYAFTSTPLDLVELVIPNLNAHQITAVFRIAEVFRVLRTNTGKIDESGTNLTEMTQTDGHPDAFSVILHKPATAK